MKYLKYARILKGLSMTELARELGTSKQNINSWENTDRKIPKKYLPLLDQVFGNGDTDFNRSLTQIETIDLEIYKLNKEIDQTSIGYIVNDYNDTTGDVTIKTGTIINYALVDHLEASKVDKMELSMLQKLKESINNTFKYSDQEEMSLSDYTDCRKSNIQLYDFIIDVVNSKSIKNHYILSLLYPLITLDSELQQKYEHFGQHWGEKNPMSNEVEVVEDLMQPVSDILHKYLDSEKAEHLKKVQETKELMKTLGISIDDLQKQDLPE